MAFNRYSLDLEASSSQYAYVADNSALSITGDLTIEAWVKFESITALTEYAIVSKDNPAPDRCYALFFQSSSASNILRFIVSSDGTNANTTAVTVSFTPSINKWYHISVTYDASAGSASFYVNGEQQGTTQTGLKTSIADTSGNLKIGATWTSPASFFDGLLSNVRIFSDIRTQQEIQDNMYSILTGTDNNLVGSWFNDANDYNDDAGTNNLTSSGSPVFSTNVPWTGANSTDWSTSVEIQADYTKVSGSSNLTSFPALIKDGNIPASIYSAIASDGKDLRITTDSAGTTEIPFEIVSITPGSSLAEIWVKIPTLSYTANTSLYLWAGNANAVAYDANAPFGSQAVWSSNYKGVWHLGEASGNSLDSTSNANDLTDNNTVGTGTGKIGASRDLISSNSEYLSKTDNSSLSIVGDISIETWLNPDNLPSGNNPIISKWATGQASYLLNYNSDGTLRFYFSDSSETANNAVTTATLSIGSWNHVVITADVSAGSSGIKIYIDGVEKSVTSTGTATSIKDGTAKFQIGVNDGGTVYYNGFVDETRLYSGALTADWITTEYNNQNDPSTFWTVAESPSPSLSPSASPSSSQSPSSSESLSISLSPSASQSPSSSISLSPSASPSSSQSPSSSISLSPSSSPSSSQSPSSSVSLSPSPSPSASESRSPSSSISPSPSSSVSLSPSPSSSISLSPSASPSSSQSPSSSISLSPSSSASASVSLSESPSPSSSESPSPSSSQSPSSSISLSPSVSESSSISLSPSASPSPGFADYSRGNYAVLPANDDDLETAYSSQDYIDVATSDDVRVGQDATNEFMIHQFKNFVGDQVSCQLNWEGQTTLNPNVSTVYLQVYNRNTTTWDTLDSDNTSMADTDFMLIGTINDLTDYKDASNVIAGRVYQEAM